MRLPCMNSDTCWARAKAGVRLDKEHGAWAWAKTNALTWTDAMENTLRKSVLSYLDWAKRHRNAKCPDKHPLHDLLAPDHLGNISRA